MRSTSVKIRMERRVQRQRSPLVIQIHGSNGSSSMEIIHKSRILVGRARQQISTNVVGVRGEIYKRVDNENSRRGDEIVVNSNVVRTGVFSGRELRGGAVGNESEIDGSALDEVRGFTIGHGVADETQVTHTNGGDDGSFGGVDMGETNGEDGFGEVGLPVEDGGDLSASNAVALEINQKHVVVKEGSGGECVTSIGSGEELRLHQTDIDIGGEATEVTAVGKRSLRHLERALEVTVGVEVVDGTAEGKGGNNIAEGSEVVLSVGVEERGRPDKVGDDETIVVVPISSVRVPAIESDSFTGGVLSGEKVGPRTEALRCSVALVVSTCRYGKSVQTTRSISSVVAHLTDDPRARRISVEFIGTTTRKIVGRVERWDHVIVNSEEKGVVLVSTVDVSKRDSNEETQETTTDDPFFVSRYTDVMRCVTKKLASWAGYNGCGRDDLTDVRAASPVYGNKRVGEGIRGAGSPDVGVDFAFWRRESTDH